MDLPPDAFARLRWYIDRAIAEFAVEEEVDGPDLWEMVLAVLEELIQEYD